MMQKLREFWRALSRPPKCPMCGEPAPDEADGFCSDLHRAEWQAFSM